MIVSNSVSAESYNVRRQSSRKMTYSNASAYQEAFYDHGSLLPWDNAKITAISRGTEKNYASIKYSDESMNTFVRRYNKTKDSTPREYSYTSKYDVLDEGSYAYSTGETVLDLNVVK